MAKSLELQIQGSSNFTFTVEGEFFPRREVVFKDAANPPVPTEIKDVWEFRGCRLVSSDGTVATLWTDFLAFLARLETRTAFPTYCRLVRDPAGTPAVVWTLGPSSYEGLKIEAVEAQPDALVPAGSYRSVIQCDIRISALKRLEDANGIVGWDQQVSVSYENGLRILEWRTRITTKEGTSAVTKAQTYAAIPASALGGDHSYLTNGTYGIEYVYTDADEQNTRTPTVCEAVSRIRQWGLTVSVTAAAGSPSTFAKSVSTKATPDETVVTTTAGAAGPNAASWVANQAPNSFTDSEVFVDSATNTATSVWTTRTARTILPARRWTIRVEVTGGKRPITYRRVSGGIAPAKFVGAAGPYKATVDVRVEKIGAFVGLVDLQFPGPMPEPWTLSVDESSETDPELIERGAAPAGSQDRWAREAHLVFYSPSTPAMTAGGQGLVSTIGAESPVTTYFR